MNKKTANSSRRHYQGSKNLRPATYRISILKRDEFKLDDALCWMEDNCGGKRWYRIYKKNIVFSFREMNDAFKFKLRWEIAY